MARTRAYRLLTRAPLGRVALRGPVAITGGVPVGMRLLARHVPPIHPQAYSLVRGSAEPEVQEALRRTVARGAVVWDVGANVGFMSLVAARLAGPDGRIYAFEPAPGSAAAVRDHAALNGLAGAIEVVQAAAGERAGRADFLLVDERSWSHLADRGRHARAEATIEVEVVRLDDLVDAGRIAPPAVVKIDVEGSEGSVLRGMERALAAHRPAIVCELHETNAEVADLLEAAGYALENLAGSALVREAGPVHLLARPQA